VLEIDNSASALQTQNGLFSSRNSQIHMLKHVHINDNCIVLYSFIVQADRTQLILHTSSFAYMVYQ